MSDDLTPLAAKTQAIYERQAARYDAERAKVLFERAWLDRFVEPLRVGAAILDVGCGAGDPIAFYLMKKDFT
ncbi:MAG: hypothetical protein ACFE0P_08120 [Oceanicaulis sp.]